MNLLTDEQAHELVRDAATDNKAWNELVLTYSSQVRSAIRSHELTASQQEDAARATWSCLAENLPDVEGSGTVAQWLTTRAHFECLKFERPSVVDARDDASATGG